MSTYRLFKRSLAALKTEDETSLDHLYGELFRRGNDRYLVADKKRGVVRQALGFMREIARKYRFKVVKPEASRILFYASSHNQYTSLWSTRAALKMKSLKSILIVDIDISTEEESEKELGGLLDLHDLVSIRIVIVALLLFLIRIIPLLRILKTDNNKNGIASYLNYFFQAYIYIPLFIQNIHDISPCLTVTCNDHSLRNRSFRLASQVCRVKTLYMQHASVSEIFPRLVFDYAFLDGRVALDLYSGIGKKYPAQSDGMNIQTILFLTGQKKKIIRESKTRQVFIVGIGANILDDAEVIKKIALDIIMKDIEVHIRVHPSLGPGNKIFADLFNLSELYHLIKFTDPKNHTLSEYFSSIDILIAGNTSLHLEAALAGVPTYYQEFGNHVNVYDYYGYVKNGVSKILPDNFAELSLTQVKNLAVWEESRSEALKVYSETFGTKWEHHEGRLSAETIGHLLSNQTFDDIYQPLASDYGFAAVYALRS
ncbi:MAG: hypothetical protein WBO24_11395 [Nitrospirales bacterium]